MRPAKTHSSPCKQKELFSTAKTRFAPRKDSFPPHRKSKPEKALPLTDFHTFALLATLCFPRKPVSLYQQTREPVSPFFKPPHKKNHRHPLYFPAGIFPQI